MIAQLIDKSIVLLLCMLLVSVYGSSTGFVTAILFAVTIAGIVVMDRFKEIYIQLIIIVYLCISIFEPEYIAFLPLMVYDIYFRKMKAAIPVSAFIYICEIFSYQDILKRTGNIPMWFGLIYIGMLCAVSILLQHRTREYIKIKSKIRVIRDDATERNIALKSKNAELIDKQDYEIRVATLQERNRIAREIHDNVGHMLTRALLQTGALKAVCNNDVIKPQLDSLHETLNTAMTNIRSSVHDLHDESTDLENAIKELTVRFPGFKISLEYEVSSDVPKNIKYCFIAITKEALNNASKHSNGDKVNILVREQPGFYQFIIEDNGTDIPPDFTGGIGIANMEERVRLINGNFNISMSNGFKINISVMK